MIEFIFIVEGERGKPTENMSVFAGCYAEAVKKLEKRTGRNLYGKIRLEREIREGGYTYIRNAR